LRDLHLELRDESRVARSGGAFRMSDETTVKTWWEGSGNPLVFDTRRQSPLNQALRVWEFEEVAPLRYWSRSPIASLGRPGKDIAAGGLSFHRHERNWLLLLSGRKRWYFHAGEPATALARVSEEELQQREADCGSLVQMHDQTPGECILIPDGHWHCTYNSTEHFTFGVGGMGRRSEEVNDRQRQRGACR
ncbi:unnamed protein product, partial [Symbiodinium microadriaticum]